MGKVDGAALMASSLKQQGVDYMFGIVGFPVQPIAAAAEGGDHLYRHAQ
jgi:2-hydroxyacyl-CoA lyase 1